MATEGYFILNRHAIPRYIEAASEDKLNDIEAAELQTTRTTRQPSHKTHSSFMVLWLVVM